MRRIIASGIMCTGMALAALVATAVQAAENSVKWEEGTVPLKSAGPLAFAPDGVLLVGDSTSAAVFAIATDDKSGDVDKADYNVEKIDAKIAAALGTETADILINDVVVNPASGNVYLSVSRGKGPEATAVVLRVNPQGELTEVDLQQAKYAKAELPNAPQPGGEGRENRRAMAITDLAFVDGRVIVAGLSNEEFASTLRSIPYPFSEANSGTGVEIFHGAHGRFETQSPVRTFASYVIQDQPHILAAYTCTPLVKFPLDQLTPGAKIRGTTVAELGNRNQPLDMFVYQKGGQDYILLANSRRGVMKISTADIDRPEGIEKRIDGTAGQQYETVEGWTNVMQLDRLNDGQALILSQTEGGSMNLFSAPLP